VTLRRLQANGRLRLVRQGKSKHEALYTKVAKPAVGNPQGTDKPPATAGS